MLCFMEFGVNPKYVLGLPWATQIGLEHEEKKPKDYDHRQPTDPHPPPLPRLTAVKDLMFFLFVETFPYDEVHG